MNPIEQLHMPHCKDLNPLLENLVDETQVVWAQRAGKPCLTHVCEAASRFLELEDGHMYVYQSERAYEEECKGNKGCFITILALSETNSL